MQFLAFLYRRSPPTMGCQPGATTWKILSTKDNLTINDQAIFDPTTEQMLQKVDLAFIKGVAVMQLRHSSYQPQLPWWVPQLPI